MGTDTFSAGIMEMYQGEVIGEVALDIMLGFFDDPDQRYRVAVMLQLETETKERLKPLVAALGGDVAEDAAGFEKGAAIAKTWSQQSWDEVMGWFQAELPKYVRFFEKLETDARVEDRELLGRVTAHEKALEEFAARELGGRGHESLEPVLALLERPPEREG